MPPVIKPLAHSLLYPFPLADDTSIAWYPTRKIVKVTTLHTLDAQVIVRVIGAENHAGAQ